MITIKLIPDIFSPEGRQEFMIPYADFGLRISDCEFQKRKSEFRISKSEIDGLYLSIFTDPEIYREHGILDKGLTPQGFIEACDIWYQGRLIPPDQYATTKIEDCSEIVFFMRPGKGGTWRAVAGAVMIIAGVIASFIPGAAYAASPYLITTGITMMLGGIIELIWPQKVKSNFEAPYSQAYGWEGVRTEYASVGTMVPICYGRVITGGKCISQRIYSTEQTAGNQKLDLLLLLSEGEIRGIRKKDDTGVCSSTADAPWIKLDGSFISDLPDVQWDYRLGEINQTVISGFEQLSANYSVGLEMSTSWYTINNAGGGEDFEQAEFNFYWPLGLFFEWGTWPWSTQIRIEYKQEPSGSWTLGWEGKWIEFRTGPFYKTVKFSLPAKSGYSFRIRRTDSPFGKGPGYGSLGADECWLQGYNRILYEDLTYPGCALVAVTAIASDRISSSQPTVATKLDGRKVEYYDGNQWQAETWDTGSADEGNVGRNLAWQSHDLIYNNEYGLGPYFDDSLKASAQFKELADYANQSVDDGQGGTEARFRSDIIIDGILDPWDMLKELLRSCHAFPVVAGAQIWPVVEKERTPVMSFGMDNVATDDKGNTLFAESWQSLDEAYNLVEVQYYDGEKDSLREIVQYPDDDSLIPSDEQIRKLTILYHNVTRRSQATRLAKFNWLKIKYQKHCIQFPTNEEAIALQPGDVFYFSHDIPQFDYSGKVFRARLDDNIIELDNAWDAVDTGSHVYKLLIRDLDDDTIETKDVTAITTENNRHLVTCSGSYSFTPAEGDPYILIEDTTVPIKYVCAELGRDEAMRRTIAALEYNPDIYDYEVDKIEPVDYSDLPNPNAPPDAPTDLYLREMGDRIGIWVNAAVPAGDANYDHCRIFMSTDPDAGWDEIGRVKEVVNFPITGVLPGVTYHIKVVSFNRIGMCCAVPPTDSITVQGVPLPPRVRGLEIFGQGNDNEFVGRDCKIRWKLATNFLGLGAGGLGEEGTGLGGTHAHYIKDTRVSVFVGGVEKRTEFVPAPGNTFIYPLEKNIEDNGGTPQRDFEFRLWYQDNYNQESPEYASLAVTNPAPSMAGLTPTLTAIYNGLKIDWSNITPAHHDMDAYHVYCDTNNPPTLIRARVDKNTTMYYITDLDANETYYVKIEPGDPYGMGTASDVVSETPALIPSSNVVDELRGNLKMTDADSNSESTLAALYDGNKTSGGVAYTASGWTKWVQYRFPVEYLVDRILLYPSVAINCYIAYSDDGQTWSYLKAEADHTLDADGKLLAASNESDAQTNYWTTASGGDVAIFPDGIKGRYFRLYIGTTHTLYELIFAREIVAEMMATHTLTADHINGSAFGTLEITSGKIKISTTDALEIAAAGNILIKQGGDIIMEGGATGNPSLLRFADEAVPGEIRFEKSTDPDKYHKITKRSSDDALVFEPIDMSGASVRLGTFSNPYYYITQYVSYAWYLSIDGATHFILTDSILSPNVHKSKDCGISAAAWDDVYADDFQNVADFYVMGHRKDPATSEIVNFSDLEVVKSFIGNGQYDERTGLEIINDAVLPSWLLTTYKQDREDRDEDDKIIASHKKGDIAYDPDGKPYLSTKILISLCMGAIRELDAEIKALKE